MKSRTGKWMLSTLFAVLFIFAACSSGGGGDDDDDNVVEDDDSEDDDDSTDDDDTSDDDDDDDSTDDDDDSADDDDDTADDDDDDTTPSNFALDYDGLDDSVVLGTGNWLVNHSYTLEAWIKPGFPLEEYCAIVGSYDVNLVHNFFLSMHAVDDELYLRGGHGTASAARRIQGTIDLANASDFTHVAYTYDYSTKKAALYINGSRDVVATFDEGPGQGGQQVVSVGANYDASESYYDGLIDEIRISDVVRYTGATFVPEEIFNPDAQTIGIWLFDEGTGTVAADATGNHSDATINGAVWFER